VSRPQARPWFLHCCHCLTYPCFHGCQQPAAPKEAPISLPHPTDPCPAPGLGSRWARGSPRGKGETEKKSVRLGAGLRSGQRSPRRGHQTLALPPRCPMGLNLGQQQERGRWESGQGLTLEGTGQWAGGDQEADNTGDLGSDHSAIVQVAGTPHFHRGWG
jgi:hypothetical protein